MTSAVCVCVCLFPHSFSQRMPLVPVGHTQVFRGPQAAPCWQGGTHGVVTAAHTHTHTIHDHTLHQNTTELTEESLQMKLKLKK